MTNGKRSLADFRHRGNPSSLRHHLDRQTDRQTRSLSAQQNGRLMISQVVLSPVTLCICIEASTMYRQN